MTNSDILRQEWSRIVKRIAHELGFDFIGISKATELTEEARQLENWLNHGRHGEMSYMANHFEKRIDPRILVPGAKSVVSLMLNYFSDQVQSDASSPKLSRYAYGEDYHFVIKRKLKEFVYRIQDEIGEVDGRVFVDSAPVLDKAWAKRGGLGWVGKHSNIINKESGSFFFIAELILDLELQADSPVKDYCGTCTKCIDACPTEAIIEPYIVDGSKCISYLTIELKTEIEQSWKVKMDDWMFGCDICQTVCPWNRFATPHSEPAFFPHEDLLSMRKEEWLELTDEVFQRLFKKSAVKRTGYNRLKQTIKFLKDQ